MSLNTPNKTELQTFERCTGDPTLTFSEFPYWNSVQGSIQKDNGKNADFLHITQNYGDRNNRTTATCFMPSQNQKYVTTTACNCLNSAVVDLTRVE